MNKVNFLIFYFLLFAAICSAQDKRGYTYVYGGSANYAKFIGDTSKPITGHYFPFVPIKIFANGSSNICDSATGSPLMFCNGYVLYDTTGNIIEDGDSLVPSKIYTQDAFPASTLTQGSIILPKGSNGLYYVFTPTMTDSAYETNVVGQQPKVPFDLFQYHIVDMNANGGSGKVVQKNIPLLTNVEMSKTGMMACKHANGYDWWLLKQALDSNVIYTFLVTKDTVVLDTIQRFPLPRFGYYDLAGQSSFSSKGDKYAFACGGGFQNTNGANLFIADFDRCYGILSNIKKINVPYDSTLTILDTLWNAYDSLITGVCFSPNDSFLYVNRRYLVYQYELNESNSSLAWVKVKQGIDTSFQQFVDYWQMQLAPDGRIYIGKGAGGGFSNSVINYPNIKGVGCDFCRKCIRCDTCDYTQSFANMPNFNLGALGSVCPPLGVHEVVKEKMDIVVYPNPSSGKIQIKNAKYQSKKELYSSVGQLLFTTKENEIDVSGYSKGVYYIKCEGQIKKVIIE